MPDISMCSNRTCPMRAKCYRYRATPGSWQSFQHFEPEADGTCKSFKEIRHPERLAPMKEDG